MTILAKPVGVALRAQLGDEGDGVLVLVVVVVVKAAVPLPHHPHVLRVRVELVHPGVVHVLVGQSSETQ